MPEDNTHKYKSEKSSFIDILIQINNLFSMADAIAIDVRNYKDYDLVRRYFSILKQLWWNIQPVIKDKNIIEEYNRIFEEMNEKWIRLYKKKQIDKLDIGYVSSLEFMHQSLLNLRQEAGLGLPLQRQRTEEEVINEAML